MHTVRHAIATAALALLASGAAHAQESLIVSFEARITDLMVNVDSSLTTHQTNGSLPFSSADTPFSAAPGDTISLTARILDGTVEVPAGDRLSVFFDLNGPDSPEYDVSNPDSVFEGSFSFYLDDTHLRTAFSGCFNCVFFGLSEEPGQTMQFNRIEAEGRFLNLTAPYEITHAVLSFDSVSAVPEPATWALWLAGAGLLAAGRRRQRPAG